MGWRVNMEMNEERQKKLFGAINILRKRSPHVFSVLEHCIIECADIPTAGVMWDKDRKKFRILIGEEIWKLDEDNLRAVLEHEILHCVFEHLSLDTKGKNRQVLNIAFDSIINDCIDIFVNDKCDASLDGRVKLKLINNGKFNIAENTSTEVYDWLMKNNPPPESGSGGNAEGGENGGQAGQDKYGSTIDDHSQFGGEEMTEIDSAIMKEVLKGIVKDNEEKFKGVGSADLDRIIKEAIKSAYDFKKLFSYAVNKNLKADRKCTWKKSNRRFGLEAKGVKKKEKPNVLLIVDTSGSITEEILAMVDYQVSYLAKHYSFTVAWGDTSLKGSKKIKRGEKVNITYKGGGGTDLRFYKKLTDAEQYDLVVFNTDGYIEPLDKNCAVKKIFCIFPGGCHVDGYKNIDISRKD